MTKDFLILKKASAKRWPEELSQIPQKGLLPETHKPTNNERKKHTKFEKKFRKIDKKNISGCLKIKN